MKTVQTCFTLSYTEEQYNNARAYVEDMKLNPKRVFWIGKKGKTDEELILSHLAHKILSGFYNNYDPAFARKQILGMQNQNKSHLN